MTAHHPWFKFYPSDWRADQALRVCSLAARGLWMECLCICHEATPYGHLLINGRPPTDAQLGALAGTPQDQIPGLLEELESAGVFSRTRNGVIYSRRMTRDDKRRNDGEKAQKTRSKLPGSRRAKVIENTQKNLPPNGVVRGVEDAPPSTQKPEARSQKPESLAQDVAEAIWAIAKQDPMPKRVAGWIDDFRIVGEWLRLGLTEREILAAVEAILARTPEVRSLWGLLRTSVPDEIQRLKAANAVEIAPPPMSHDERMEYRLRRFKEVGLWSETYGPKPDNAYGLKPDGMSDELLTKYGYLKTTEAA